ncbi:MAG: hypothetical protein U5L03_00040 [Burkholderiaceae bacterium]|nr:hypothetical protein [Burkholderiaceae bacterium]
MFIVAGLALAPLAQAAGNLGSGHGGGAHGGSGKAGGGAKKKPPQINSSRTDKRTNNVRSTSVNNVNVNKNVNVNVDNNRGGCCNNGWDNDYHPIATAAAVTATVAVTSAIVGSIVNAPPPGCVPVNYGGYVYQQCGSTWYQPQGSQYVVIAPPY